ncbi:MAG: chemotaxis-specific protein-glutamate methyltransferase CheB [Myxococcales bacterium]
MTAPRTRAAAPGKLRVLVVDDSAANRRTLTAVLEGSGEVEVVGTATDGEQGLRQALALAPDAITLDLEMPRLDGFAFLRLLMAKAPTPVLVISGYAKKNDVFRALELGALDFIAKPSGRPLESLADELLAKVRMVRFLRRDGVRAPEPAVSPPQRGERIAVIGASTGGPPALQKILGALPAELGLAVLVAQHMPPRFTRAFAERLDRLSPFSIAEARAGERVEPGRVLIAPGGRHMRLVRASDGLRVALSDPAPADKYVPSIDELFRSAAAAKDVALLGVLLTGMGSDGRDGMLALKAAGAETVAESEESAVIFGMPREAIAAGAVNHVLPLDRIAAELTRFGSARAGAKA